MVLIVEPRKALRDQLRGALEESFDVLAAQTPSGALTGMAKHHPPAVLLAMGQRKGNGLELASRLRDTGVGIPPFIVVYGDDGTAPEALADVDLKARYGVDRHLATGVTIRKLDAILTERFRAGWQAMKMDSGPAKSPENAGWTNPLLSTDAVSARRAPDADKKPFSLKRLFGR